jgi:hypothetical protein
LIKIHPPERRVRLEGNGVHPHAIVDIPLPISGWSIT